MLISKVREDIASLESENAVAPTHVSFKPSHNGRPRSVVLCGKQESVHTVAQAIYQRFGSAVTVINAASLETQQIDAMIAAGALQVHTVDTTPVGLDTSGSVGAFIQDINYSSQDVTGKAIVPAQGAAFVYVEQGDGTTDPATRGDNPDTTVIKRGTPDDLQSDDGSLQSVAELGTNDDPAAGANLPPNNESLIVEIGSDEYSVVDSLESFMDSFSDSAVFEYRRNGQTKIGNIADVFATLKVPALESTDEINAYVSPKVSVAGLVLEPCIHGVQQPDPCEVCEQVTILAAGDERLAPAVTATGDVIASNIDLEILPNAKSSVYMDGELDSITYKEEDDGSQTIIVPEDIVIS